MPQRTTPVAVMRDAVDHGDPGAVYLLTTALQLRVIRRTRRSLDAVRNEFHSANPARWLGVLQDHVWNMYRLFFKKVAFEVAS